MFASSYWLRGDPRDVDVPILLEQTIISDYKSFLDIMAILNIYFIKHKVIPSSTSHFYTLGKICPLEGKMKLEPFHAVSVCNFQVEQQFQPKNSKAGN